MLERYITVERQEFLDGRHHDAVWVTREGRPMSDHWIAQMLRKRMKQRFGVAFGPHRLRHSLITTAAVVDGTNAIGPALVLGHSPQTALKSYNRARNFAAGRRHEAWISELEAAAIRS